MFSITLYQHRYQSVSILVLGQRYVATDNDILVTRACSGCISLFFVLHLVSCLMLKK